MLLQQLVLTAWSGPLYFTNTVIPNTFVCLAQLRLVNNLVS